MVPYTSIWSDLARTSFSQGYLDAGGIRTRYLSSGSPDKPLLLLLHATGGHAEAYVRNLGPLGEHFWTVAFDFIGHGWSGKPAVDYEIKDYAEHVLGVLRALGREKAILSGESVGGWVAAYLAVHHPGAVERLVLNSTGGWKLHAEVMSRLKSQYTTAVANPSAEQIRGRLEAAMFDKSLLSDDMVESRRRIYADPDFAANLPRVLRLREVDVRQRNMISESQYRSIKAPTLVLWTSNHGTYTLEEGKEIASMIPGARFVVMDRCANWPHYENASLFNRIHISFLKDEPLPAEARQ